jgi:hypothetical protein
MTGIWNSIFAVLAAAATSFAALRCVHMLQLESYQGNMYLKWLRRAGGQDLLLYLLSGGIALMLRIGWVFFYYSLPAAATLLWYGADAAYIAAMLYIGGSNKKQPAKKPLHFTGASSAAYRSVYCQRRIQYDLFLPFYLSGWGRRDYDEYTPVSAGHAAAAVCTARVPDYVAR